MIEEITEKFEKAMKKGFISTLILLVLDKEPMHGRQIKKAIEERTFGVWEPPDSTMYTILKDLREKDLIKPQNEEEKTIVYEITDAGKDTLEIMMKKEQEIRESMRSIITTTFGFKDELMDIKVQSFLDKAPFLNGVFDRTENETLEILNFQKIFLEKRIEVLNKKLQKVEKKISKLENDREIEN
ncbi:MAG: PadR family transcriptional regulator [Promethearchaeota archaeon]